MILLSYPTGNANVRAALQALLEEGLLAEFTSLHTVVEGGAFDYLSHLPGFGDFARRRLPREYGPLTHCLHWPDLLRVASNRLGGIDWLTRRESGFVCSDRNNRRLGAFAAKRLERVAARDSLRGVYCYEGAALETFRKAKALGLKTVYDLTTGYWRAKVEILGEEAEREPEWACLLPTIRDSAEKCARKDAELEMADLVITASSFTERTLKEYPLQLPRTASIPYGAPAPVLDRPKALEGKKLKVLFVGSLSQQKGLSYLFRAWDEAAPDLEGTIVGTLSSQNCRPLNEALKKWTYIPSLPHQGVLELMRQHHVLVFPSLFDGFGLVLLEAMSQGMTVIASMNCGGPDFIDEGVDGFVVPIRDAGAVAEKLRLLSGDRERLEDMRQAALGKAQKLSWEIYRRNLVAKIRSLVQI